MEDTGKKPRVLLIREWEQQLSSSGCCGRIEGSFLGSGGERVFSGRRRHMEHAGTLYRSLRERYGDRVEIHVLDPRNLLSLIPSLLRDGWRHGRSPLEMIRTVACLSVNMVVVDGRIVSRHEWPDPEVLLDLLDERLSRTRTATAS